MPAIDPAILELILKTTGSQQVKDLIEVVEFLRKRLDELADEFKEGKISEEDFKTATDLVIKTLKEEEQILDRVTRAEQELAEATLEAGKAAEEAAGQGEGEGGRGGFAGFTSNMMKAEKVASGLAGGTGFGRMGGMLESITVALGGPAGVGMAAGGLIFAVEALIPKLEALIGKMDGTTEAAERMKEKVKEANEQMAKFAEQPTEEEAAGAKAVKPLLAGRQATFVAQGVEQALMAEMPMEEQQFLRRAETVAAIGGPETWETAARRTALRQQLQVRRAEIIRGAEAGRPQDIARISGMAGQFPGLFPMGVEQRFRQALPENIEAARQQAMGADVVTTDAEAAYAASEAAAKENLGIQQQFNKAFQDKRKQQDKQFESTMRADEHFAKQTAHDLDKDEAAFLRQTERAIKEKKREDDKNARELVKAGTLAGRQRAAEEEAEGYIQQAMPLAPVGFQQRAAHHLAENYNMGLQMGATIEERIIEAVMQTRRDMARGVMNGMKRQEVFSDPFVGEK
jgi:hypothetical protein